MLGDRDQRMTMQRMTALASQYRRKAMRQPGDQQQLIPRHSTSQQGGLVRSALYTKIACQIHRDTLLYTTAFYNCICSQLLLDGESKPVSCLLLACCFACSLSTRFLGACRGYDLRHLDRRSTCKLTFPLQQPHQSDQCHLCMYGYADRCSQARTYCAQQRRLIIIHGV